MKNKNIFTLFLVIGMIISVNGCTTLGRNLTEDNSVKIEILDQDKRVYVSSANAYEKNNKLIIHGSMRKNLVTTVRLRGHVDIKVIGPDNELLAVKQVRPKPVNPRPNVRSASFTAHLDILPPSGSTIQVTAHKGIHSEII